ncbi:MAG TPA: hypothetical protein VGM10_04650 [Actinocrinis sp.]|jgi:hypothetical protein
MSDEFRQSNRGAAASPPLADHVDDGAAEGFAWTVVQFDAGRDGRLLFARMVAEAANFDANSRRGEPIKSAAELELDVLADEVEQRELRIRAEVGDPAALTELVEQAAQYEIALADVEEHNRREMEKIYGVRP